MQAEHKTGWGAGMKITFNQRAEIQCAIQENLYPPPQRKYISLYVISHIITTNTHPYGFS